MDNKYNFFKQDALRPTAEQLLDTKLYYQNAVDIIAHWEQWKDIDRLYFTPLYLEMTYNMGWVAEIAPDPVWLGSFVRSALEHPDLFQYRCPACGTTVFPFRYVGSPLSGRVDLEGHCSCGWKGFESVSGWRVRAIALRETLQEDKAKWKRFHRHNKGGASTVAELLEWLKSSGE